MTFDDVLPTLLRVCESWEQIGAVVKIAIVRDLRGRIRLVVDAKKDEKAFDAKELCVLLSSALGDWFTGEILGAGKDGQALKNVASRVIKAASENFDTRYTDDLGGEKQATPGRWKLLERRVGKHPWLEGHAPPPWPPSENEPTVVTFYSFKGGVGRTTTLAACALLAAAAGESVVIIDLDLEAPGVASLFGIEDTPRGVLDVLVDHLAQNTVDLTDALHAPTGIPDEYADRIKVVPAGRLDLRYLEKLARLDFTGSTVDLNATASPVRDALQALVEKVRAEYRPRWIFLDARAGLHDLAGLSLHGLAHVDVIFSRANAQGIAGLDLVVAALAKRQRDVASHTVLVHALAPVADTEAKTEQARMREQTHAMFTKHGLFTGEIPEQTADDADHWPWTLQREERIERNELRKLVETLAREDFRAVWSRIRLVSGAMRGDV